MGKSDLSKEMLEIQVQSVMGIMEPSYLEGKTEAAEAMRRLLLRLWFSKNFLVNTLLKKI